MAFEAGAIIGDLELRTSQFDASIEHGEEAAGESEGKLSGIFSELGENIGSELGEAVSGVGELMEGLGGGPVAAVMAVVAAFAALFEITKGAAEHIEEVSLAAVKAGTSVGFMSDLAEQASTVNVGVGQLSAGFRVLETQAEAAAEGDKKAEESFKRVGISASELAELMKNPEDLFKRVQSSIGGMTDASERMAASRGLLGRGGSDLIPLFAQTAEQAEHLHSIFEQTGAGVTEQDAAMGASFKEFTSVGESAWEGLEKALATPILQYIQEHLPELEQMVVNVADVLKNVLVPIIDIVGTVLQPILSLLEGIVDLIDLVINGVKEAVGLDVHDALGIVDPKASAGGSSAGGAEKKGDTYNVVVAHDAGESGKQFGERVISAVRSGVTAQQYEFQAAARQAFIEQSVAGGW